jgi:hypothetical protein
LLDEIGRRVGRDPAPSYRGLLEYEDTWRSFGAPPLSRFALASPLAEHEELRGLGATPKRLSGRREERPAGLREGFMDDFEIDLLCLVAAKREDGWRRERENKFTRIPGTNIPDLEGVVRRAGENLDRVREYEAKAKVLLQKHANGQALTGGEQEWLESEKQYLGNIRTPEFLKQCPRICWEFLADGPRPLADYDVWLRQNGLQG